VGISAYYHDSAACIIKNGKILAAAQEERFSRIKQDPKFPEKALDFCLKKAGININDVDYLVFYEKPNLKFQRLLKTYLSYAPFGFKSYIKSMPLWFSEKLWIKKDIKTKSGFKGDIICVKHHESHSASAFFPSPYKQSAILTMDGVGEWTTTSFGEGKNNNIDIQSEIHFPHSIGLLYSAFTYYTGFKVNSGEYKLMGLAPYGEPKYVNIILNELIDLKEDGSFRLNMKYFNYCIGFTMTNKRFDNLFGRPPRRPESEISQMDMDLASSIQNVTEEIVLRIGKHIYQQTGQKNLCLAGGVALNCVANGRLYREGPFDNIWAQPAAGDAGGALGAALFAWHQILGKSRQVNNKTDLQKGSYLGTEYDEHYIEDYLIKKNVPHEKIKTSYIPERISQFIIDQKVIGWFQGRMEFGPRALGSRSIIGDARSPEMQSVMNLKIKYRESFRPFAPSVIIDKANDWFDMQGNRKIHDYSSPYMLNVGVIRKEKRQNTDSKNINKKGLERLNLNRSQVPAITHVDYSARIQTVHEDTNSLYYQMIKVFELKTGCPMIINTSFNVRGEPIVESPEDAYRCFMRTEMDYLLLGNFLLKKENQPKLEEKTNWRNEFQLD